MKSWCIDTDSLNKRHLLRLCKRFDTDNYELCRTLKNKKVIGLMKDELSGKIMTDFAALGPKTII